METRNSPENKSNESNKPTDSSEIVHRHLEDENHEITDEDIRNVKVVGTADDEPITTGAEVKARFDIGEENKDEVDGNVPGPQRPATPWDVISD